MAGCAYDGGSVCRQCGQFPEDEIKQSHANMLASVQAHALMWVCMLLVMLEEDAAMLAFVFS